MCNVYFRSSEFSYDKESKRFSAEASMLQRGNQRPLFGRAYQDSCDEGFIMISDKTGSEVLFVVNETKTNEGDLLFWTLTPDSKAVRKNPALKGVSVIIFND